MKWIISIVFNLILFQPYSGFSHSKPTSKSDTLYANQIKPYGRYRLDKQNAIELISSGVHFGFRFQGDRCALYLFLKNVQEHNYIQYELDGVYQKRIRINGSSMEPILLKATGEGDHTLWIYKATEAHSGPVFLSKIYGNRIRPISEKKSPLIEFIGNSITCGAASDTSDYSCGLGDYQDHHNAYLAYGPRLARNLGVHFILSSVSGIGVYRTWNKEGPAMGEVYTKTDFQLKDSDLWNFRKFKPKIVSIALGTNDLSRGDGKTIRADFNEKLFIDHYLQFIELVKSKYPKAQIVLLSSPMVSEENKKILENCLSKIKEQINDVFKPQKPIQTFFFKTMHAHGCSGHPSVEDHLILAEELKPFFISLLQP